MPAEIVANPTSTIIIGYRGRNFINALGQYQAVAAIMVKTKMTGDGKILYLTIILTPRL